MIPDIVSRDSTLFRSGSWRSLTRDALPACPALSALSPLVHSAETSIAWKQASEIASSLTWPRKVTLTTWSPRKTSPEPPSRCKDCSKRLWVTPPQTPRFWRTSEVTYDAHGRREVTKAPINDQVPILLSLLGWESCPFLEY